MPVINHANHNQLTRSSIMANRDYTIKPFGKIHELQISDKEMYVLEPLLLDAVSNHESRIADLRKELGFLFETQCKDVLSMLAEIQALEGEIVILKNLAAQLDL